jgi:hypothetical protein
MTAYHIDRESLVRFCDTWKIAQLSLFGSAVRGDLQPESDLDLLVTFEADFDWSLLDHIAMTEELSEIVGRDVDLISRRAVETSPNRIRRTEILSSAELFYAAR